MSQSKGSTVFFKLELHVLSKKTVLKISLNPGLNLIIFLGTGPRCLIEDQPSSRRTGEIWSNFVVLVNRREAKLCAIKLQFMNVLLESARPCSRTIKELTKNQAIQNGKEYVRLATTKTTRN